MQTPQVPGFDAPLQHMQPITCPTCPAENLYIVITGSKTFSLLPPADVWRMHRKLYPVACWQQAEAGALQLHMLSPRQQVTWSPVTHGLPDTDPARHSRFHDSSLPPPLTVTVNAGDVLYLPAQWQHQVTQTPGKEGFVAAVNLWFDMAMDCRWCYSKLVEQLGHQLDADEAHACRLWERTSL